MEKKKDFIALALEFIKKSEANHEKLVKELKNDREEIISELKLRLSDKDYEAFLNELSKLKSERL